jgi:hypothetical protein
VDICRKAGISQATYFYWNKRYAHMMPSEMKRLLGTGGGKRSFEADRGHLSLYSMRRRRGTSTTRWDAIAQQKRRARAQAALHADRNPPSRTNEVWAMDSCMMS